MKQIKNLLPLLALVLLAACAQDKPDPSKEASVDDIKGQSKINYSEIVRNPVTADSPVKVEGGAKFEFKQKVFDFGTVKEGEVVEHDYVFTNVGKTPLVISNAQGSCGCTVPEFPKEPIAPGADGKIKVKFNSEGKGGNVEKEVTLTANTYPETVTKLTIKGKVTPKK